MYEIYNDDCLERLDKLEENSIDCIVTDVPYGLTSGKNAKKGFMGKEWDGTGIERNPELWAKCLRVLKPGGHLLSFAGTRTYHRIVCAIEDAGFEIRDMINWVYGSGFPKSLNIGIAVDKKRGVASKVVGETRIGKTSLGENSGWNSSDNMKAHKQGGVHEIKEAQNEWRGWGTALKPAHEPIVIARKPLDGTVVQNVVKNCVGGLNIDQCRVEYENTHNPATNPLYRVQNGYSCICGEDTDPSAYTLKKKPMAMNVNLEGRYPANVILSYNKGDEKETCGGFPQSKGGSGKPFKRDDYTINGVATNFGRGDFKPYNDDGSAARYFKNCPFEEEDFRSYYYSAKASRKDRDEGLDNLVRNTHATVKPTELMRYLIRLVAPKGATILDPFMGSGSTGKAVMLENAERNVNYKFVGIEKEQEYYDIAKARIDYVIEKYNLKENE